MSRLIRYLSHPQVAVDPTKPVPDWSLSDAGRKRIRALAASDGLAGTRHIISSGETKALETAGPLAQALGCEVVVRNERHENDRSATGFLPPDEFERVADRFFAEPEKSVRGWETAHAAQARLVGAVEACLATYNSGDILFVGHGGVGTLLYCHLAQQPINRRFDQQPGGGCYFAFRGMTSRPESGWQPLENLIR